MEPASLRSRRESGRFVRFFCLQERTGARTNASDAESEKQSAEIERESAEIEREQGSRTRRGEQEIYRDIPEPLRALIEPVVDEHGCELVDVETTRGQGRGLLRIIVDNPQQDGRVPIERCVAISREVETLLDAADTMPGAYQLEVSSPGLDRVLAREKDFAAACGQSIKLQTRRPIEGRKRYRGRLIAFEQGALRMEVEGEEALIPFDEVEKANTIYEFTSADFARGSGRRGSSESGGV